MDVVDLTLARWRQHPFTWGDADCMLSIGDYIALRGGKDVTGLFRGHYDSMEGAMAFMTQYGGAPGLIDLTGIERLPEGTEPLRGDVVAMAVDEEDGGSIGAICTGGMIGARLERSVVEVATRFVVLKGVWRCPR